MRFISATHRNLGQEVLACRFRRDLFFRVNGINLDVEPLRERRQAIAALAGELLETRRAPGSATPASLGAGRRGGDSGHRRSVA